MAQLWGFRGRGELSIAWRDIIGGTQVPPAFSGSLARPGPGLFMFRLRCEGSRQELSVCLSVCLSVRPGVVESPPHSSGGCCGPL